MEQNVKSNSANEPENFNQSNDNFKTPNIPKEVYDNLPALLKDSCNIFNDSYEKDIYLTGALAVLGGCFHKLYAYNEPDKKKVATNLSAIIVGPPASGKGALNYCKKLAKKIGETYSEKSKKLGSKHGNKLFIPGNISSTGMIQLLTKNSGVGVMVESEIDTIVSANKQEWGNYSVLMRNSFENEEYSMYRKGKEKPESYHIERVKLSIAISGTPNQFKQLISSTDNGLFSRVAYYIFEPEESKLKFTGRLSSDIDVETKFASFAKIANDYYELHDAFSEIRVVFSKEQLDKIADAIQELMDTQQYAQELDGNLKRAFVMAQKIGAIISLLSECEKGSLQEIIECTETSLNVTIELIKKYMFHVLAAHELLPQKVLTILNNTQLRFLSFMPDEFTRSEAIELGIKNGLSQRICYYIFNVLLKKDLIILNPSGKYSRK